MESGITIVGRKRKEIDEKKLALAFLLLAKSFHAEKNAEQPVANGAAEEAA